MCGQLTLRSERGQIAWVEQGTLLWNGSRLPVSRSYRLLRAGEGWWLYFPDGRPFHPWIPGQWVHHPCREDSYRGLITITGPDQWRTLWEVDGPDKAQRIITQLSRSSALYLGYLGQSRFSAVRRPGFGFVAEAFERGAALRVQRSALRCRPTLRAG